MAYITENIFVFQNNEKAATLVYHPSSVGIIEYFWYETFAFIPIHVHW